MEKEPNKDTTSLQNEEFKLLSNGTFNTHTMGVVRDDKTLSDTLVPLRNSRDRASTSISTLLFARLIANPTELGMDYIQFIANSPFKNGDFGARHFDDHVRGISLIESVANDALKMRLYELSIATLRELYKLKELSNLEEALKDFLDSKSTSSRNAAKFAKEKLDGFNNDGSMDDGSMDDGSMDDGSMDDGSMDDGSMDDGSMNDGSMDDGSMDDGSMDDGSMDDGSKKLTIVIQLDTNYPNRVLLGTEMAVLDEIIRLTNLLKNSFKTGVEMQIDAVITKLNVVKENKHFEDQKRK